MAICDRSSALSELRIRPVGAGVGIPCLRSKDFSSQNRPLAARACKFIKKQRLCGDLPAVFPMQARARRSYRDSGIADAKAALRGYARHLLQAPANLLDDGGKPRQGNRVRLRAEQRQ